MKDNREQLRDADELVTLLGEQDVEMFRGKEIILTIGQTGPNSFFFKSKLLCVF